MKWVTRESANVDRKDDHRKLALETPMYDALYAFCTRLAAEGPVF